MYLDYLPDTSTRSDTVDKVYCILWMMLVTCMFFCECYSLHFLQMHNHSWGGIQGA